MFAASLCQPRHAPSGARTLGTPNHFKATVSCGSTISGNGICKVFDDGNTRRAKYNPSADSRCQLYAVNETGHGANLNYNADVGSYSFGLGSAQLLTNGNKFCDAGVIGGGFSSSTYTENAETGKNANVVIQLKAGADTYRSFRMRDPYSPVNP